MRKQSHFWPGEEGLGAGDVDRLIDLSRGLLPREVPIASITDEVVEHLAILEGESLIGVIRFEVQPEPDDRNCTPEEASLSTGQALRARSSVAGEASRATLPVRSTGPGRLGTPRGAPTGCGTTDDGRDV